MKTMELHDFLKANAFKKAQKLHKHGAKVAKSLKHAVSGADIIITMLSDDNAVLSIINKKEFIENINSNSILIDMSSTKPKTAIKIWIIILKLNETTDELLNLIFL